MPLLSVTDNRIYVIIKLMNWEIIISISSIFIALIGTLLKMYADYTALKKEVQNLALQLEEQEKQLEHVSNKTDVSISDVKNILIEVRVKLDLIMKNFSMEIIE